MNLEDAIYCLMALSGTAYVILGGADFGSGIWEFNSAFEVDESERELSTQAMGPVWEANHVWLIFLLTLMFTCFPQAFAALSQALWLPLFLASVGIVFRGTAFILRAYTADSRQRSGWGVIFACSSTLAPLFMGVAAGTVASGTLPFNAEGRFSGDYLSSWLSPLGIFCGFFSVGISAYLSAVYLTRDASRANEAALVESWRRRSLASGKWCGILAFAGIGMLATASGLLWEEFRRSALLYVLLSASSGLLSYAAMHRRLYTAAALTAAGAVAFVILGWAFAQYPWIIPHTHSIQSARAHETVLRLVVYAVIGGAVVLCPSLWYLFYVFKLRSSRS